MGSMLLFNKCCHLSHCNDGLLSRAMPGGSLISLWCAHEMSMCMCMCMCMCTAGKRGCMYGFEDNNCFESFADHHLFREVHSPAFLFCHRLD